MKDAVPQGPSHVEGSVIASQLRALFFPYASFRNLATLKTAVLLYDEISIIHPDAAFSNWAREGDSAEAAPRRHSRLSFFRRTNDSAAIGAPSHTAQAQSYLGAIAPLIEEGIVRVVDPSVVIDDFGDSITDGVIRDVFNAEFRKVCEPYADSSWTISVRKLPAPLDSWSRNLLVNLPEMATDQILPAMLGGSGYVDMVYREICYATPVNFEPAAAQEYFRSNVKDKGYTRSDYLAPFMPEREDSPNDIDTRTVTLPFILGEAIMLGHAVAVAAHEGLIPLCDDRIHFTAFAAKLNHAISSPGVRSLLEDYGYIKTVKAAALSVQAAGASLPSLGSVPIETIVTFRRERAEALANFRIEMTKLAAEVDSTPWEDDFARHITDVIDAKILPALNEIERQMKAYNDKFWIDAMKTASSAAPLPIVGAIWAGLPPYVAVAIGGGVATLSLILDRMANTRQVRRNGLAFLIDAAKLR